MDRRTYVQIPPVFYRTSSPFGAEALLTSKPTRNKPLSRARVPMTISCLWATGSSFILCLFSPAVSGKNRDFPSHFPETAFLLRAFWSRFCATGASVMMRAAPLLPPSLLPQIMAPVRRQAGRIFSNIHLVSVLVGCFEVQVSNCDGIFPV